MRFNKLIPELAVSSLEKSLGFYVKGLGFKEEYSREEDKFVFLSLQGSQLMLQEREGKEAEKNSPWFTGELEKPFGRGIHFQIEVENIEPILETLAKNNYPLKSQPKEYWFRKGQEKIGMKGFLIMDPNGYLFLINQAIENPNPNR